MSKVIRKELDLAGKNLVLETGELAEHANAAVLATYGETVVLATAVMQPMAQDIGFFPLAVDYEEKLYAGGRISTSRFIKREGRPTEAAILTGRLVDRSVRPLFPKDLQMEVQVIITVLSVDNENDTDVLSLIAASAALSISDIPWNGPLSGIRIGHVDGKLIVNPTEAEKATSTLDLIVASKGDDVVMIEAGSSEVDEKTMTEAVKLAVAEGKKVLKLIEDFTKDAGKEKFAYEAKKLDPKKQAEITKFIEDNILTKLKVGQKQDEGFGHESIELLKQEFIKEEEESEVNSKVLDILLDDAVTDYLRKQILDAKIRIDGRKPDEIRPLSIRVGILPRTHGSALFQRGETQVLSIATLASPALEQLIDGMEGEATKRYMHHYNFPPFSSGEVKRLGSPGRREIGHGALAEKALIPILPKEDQFPYTIRVVSEVLSSAGSTSMASTCGSTLALMDAGTPIKEPVAGISIGLITDKNDRSKYVTITDIAYQEDANGDMDFKVAGTKNGITAIQLDIKLEGISLKVVEEAFEKAKAARLKILDAMLKVIPASRGQISPYAPTVILVKIDPAKIGGVIGSGGRTINKIIAETGAAIDIDDEGTVMISGKDPQAAQKAAEWIEGIVKEAEVGEEYEGKVTRVLPFGAFVEVLPGKEGLVHISKLANHRVDKVEDVVNIGDTVKVKVVEIDDQGRVNLAIAGVEPRQDSDARGERSRDGSGGGNRRNFGPRNFDRNSRDRGSGGNRHSSPRRGR